MSRFKQLKDKEQRGSFLVAAIIIILFLTAIALSLSGLIAEQYSHTKRELYAANAVQAAEAGIEESVHALNDDDSFAGYTSPQTFFNNSAQGKGTFTTTVTENADGKSKSIISVGKVYQNSGDTAPLVRKVKVTVVGTSSKGYSVFTGPGGLNLSEGATIVNSSIFVNGYIHLTGGATIGKPDHPLDVDVANYQCPAGGGADYPQLCNDGTQPISVTWGTYIYGSVCATGQTDLGPAGDNIQGGNGGTGLKPGCIAPQASMPSYDRQTQIDNITTSGSYSDSQYNCSNWNPDHGSDGFTVSWPSNLKLNGNVSLSASCKLTLTGDVYITGNLVLSGGTKVKVADSAGNKQPVILVDGTITVKGGASIDENSDGTSAKFISYENSTGNPAISDLTGQQLYDSQNTKVISLLGGAQVPGAIFDAYWGKISISGGATAGAAIGQTIDMSGGGTVTFGTSLASGKRTWTVRSYQRLYD